MAKRTLSLLGALISLYALRLALQSEDLPAQWRVHVPEVDRHLALGELRNYALFLTLGLPAAFLLHAAFSGPAYASAARLAGRLGYWAPAVLATFSAFCISTFVTDGAWFTDDEQAYLFQMQTYARLKLTIPTIEPEAYFHHPFVMVSRVVDGVPHWAGIYPFMQPMMMTLSRFLGSPLLSQWLGAGLIAWNTGLLAERLSGQRRLGLLGAWLLVASPGLVGLAATYHTAVLGCLLSLLAVRALLWTRDAPTLLRGAVAGLCAGAAFLTRGLEGTLLVLVCGFGIAAQLVSFESSRLKLGRAVRRTLWALLGYSLSGLLALAAYMAVNRGTTGDWLRHTYAVWEARYGGILGFGVGMMWGRTHTPMLGLVQTLTSLVRINFWSLGWPSALAAPLLALLKPLRSRAVLLLALLSAAQLLGYVFLPFGSVHDFGSAYHVWHVPWIACIVALLVKNAARLVPSAARLCVALSVVGLLGFWPTQIEKWSLVADDILAPVRAVDAATGGQKAVVLYSSYTAFGRPTWVNRPPAPGPDNQAIWMMDAPGAAEVARQALPTHKLVRFTWENNAPVVRPVP